MSWDLLLLPLPAELHSAQGLPDDFPAKPLGPHRDVQAALLKELPEIDLSDPTWGDLNGETWSIELNIGHEDPVDSIMLHVRGSGDDVLSGIFRIAAAVDCRVIDCSDGEFLVPGDTSNRHAFQAFRDRIRPQSAPARNAPPSC
jgi:hypothetical protein